MAGEGRETWQMGMWRSRKFVRNWVRCPIPNSAKRGTPSVAIFGGIHGARKCAVGAEGRAAKLGSHGGLRRAREVACKVPEAWQSMCVDDSTAEAHARARSAGKCARRGEQVWLRLWRATS
eukprot:4001089-Prymnesium_polylepis.1